MNYTEWDAERTVLVNYARSLRTEAVDDLSGNRPQHALAKAMVALLTLALSHERPERD